jgi:hypothetical protein
VVSTSGAAVASVGDIIGLRAEQEAMQEQEIGRRMQALCWLRSVHSSLGAVRVRKQPVVEVEREIDRLLCSALGIESVDAIKVGARRQRIESWALLMTGLSAPELVRAKRLRDSGRLQREDLLHLLSVVDQMAAADNDLVGCERQILWDRLGSMRALGRPIETKPIVNGTTATVHPVQVQQLAAPLVPLPAGDPCDTLKYSYTVQAVPVWDEVTPTGNLPLQQSEPAPLRSTYGSE